MVSISIPTENKISTILVGESIDHISKYLPQNVKIFIITDQNIHQKYGSSMQFGKVILIPTGETKKTLSTVEFIIGELVLAGADRFSYLIGFGGGIVTDITGFVASIFMRGVSFGFVSTSLLSQVDASVGGKNGVNFDGFKNMVGVFNQPDFVICDPLTLHSLPEQEYRAGFSEIIKAAMIADYALFEYIEQNTQSVLAKEADFLNHVVAESVRIKAKVVAADERERGDRKKLNLGHTFAHSIEKNVHLIHGQAVAVGLVEASKLSVQKGWMTQQQAQRVIRLLEAIGLPTQTDLDRKSLFEAMYKDKKKQGEYIEMILPVGLGDCKVEKMDYQELSHYIINPNL